MTQDLKEQIKKNPYRFICDFYEELYPYMGKRVMEVMSLMPISLIIPPLTDQNGKKIRSRINFLLLANPGTAKTALSTHFQNFTYDPFPFESITDSKLDFALSFKKRVTLITSDISRIFRDNYLIKGMENIIGDEGKLSRFNRNTGDEEQKVDAIAYLAGTPDNLTHSIKGGIIFRVIAMVVYHTEKEHSEILKKVNHSIGRGLNDNFIDRENLIKEYYQELLSIQEGNSPIYKPIQGYIIPEEFREKIERKLIPMFTKPFKETNFEFVRELQQVYRFLVSSACLNYFNRELEEGKIRVTKEDLDIALKLSEEEIKTKLVILNSLNRLSEKNLRNNAELKAWAFKQKQEGIPLSFAEYKTMETIVKSKQT